MLSSRRSLPTCFSAECAACTLQVRRGRAHARQQRVRARWLNSPDSRLNLPDKLRPLLLRHQESSTRRSSMHQRGFVRAVLAAVACGTGLLAGAAVAQDIKVGVTLSATGPAASLGIPERNTFALMPKTIGGKKVEYIVLDDATDTTNAVKNTRKLITEDKVDVVIGSTVSPNSLAMVDTVAEGETPMISLAASSRIVDPVDAKRRWVFKTPQNDQQMAVIIASHMLNQGVKTVGYLGFSDAYGEGWWTEFSKVCAARGLNIIVSERFQRTDTSVTAQVLKITQDKPDAVLIGASGTPAALPQKALKERGYAGKIYQTHGVANNDFLRVCGKDCEGTFLPAGPVLVASQLPADHAVKKSAQAYIDV